MNIPKCKSIILLFMTMAGSIVFAGCTTVMNYTPQQMSDLAIGHFVNDKVDPKTDPNPQTLAFDQTACANQARLEHPIVHIDEGGVIAGSVAQGGENPLNDVVQTYQIQIFRQSTYYALCLVQHGHVVSGTNEQDLEQTIQLIETPGFHL